MATTTYGFGDVLRNGTKSNQSSIVIRAEEALIVMLVLALWVAAIALFFNRWGKIRMLEPYQPKFIQQHRPSCSLVDQALLQHQQRSFSKFNVHGEVFAGHQKIFRPRQNSVFVGSPAVTFSASAPRKAKSAFDLQNLVESHSALREGVASKNYLDGCSSRRQSMLTIISKRPPTENFRRSSVLINKERRLSSKDLTELGKNLVCEKVHYRGDKDVQKNEFRLRQLKSGETKLRSAALNQNVLFKNRRNSIAYLDVKPSTGNPNRFVFPERRFSLFQGQKTTLSVARAEPEETLKRPEVKTQTSDFRRNSILVSSSVDIERNYLNPKETVKSGVIDFRRNSLLIINNLTEDIDHRFFGRNLSLASSKVALGLDPYTIVKRDSTNPFFGHDIKRKTSSSKIIPSLNPKFSISHAEERKRETGHPFGSLDFEQVSRKSEDKSTNRLSFAGESKLSFCKPGFGGSTTSLNTCCSSVNFKVFEESRSAENVDSGTKSTFNISSERESIRDRGKFFSKGDIDVEEESNCRRLPKVNITESFINLDKTHD